MLIRDEQWIQTNGTPIFVEEMSEAHAKNALRMVLRQHRESGRTIINDAADTSWIDEFWEDEYRYGKWKS